jgi:anaerobic magnesium-protoporphyrin IX monomethyl ester cyclase
MKTVIVAPLYKTLGEFYELPLGLGYVSSYLKSKNLDVQFVNLNENHNLKDALKKADVLCTGGLSVHYHKVKEILDTARSINPGIKTIVGGGLVGSSPELMLDMLKFDVGVCGEGEEATYNIISTWMLGEDVRGIVKAKPIEDLDALPYPDYEGLGITGYLDRQLTGDEHYFFPLDKPRCLPILSSRSCPHSCSFCFHPMGKKYRQRSLDGYFKEVEFLIEKYQITMVTVLDELIAEFPERITEFCERMKKYGLKWMTQARVDSVTPDTLRMMKDSGCIQISFGIEHVNQTILDSFRKKTKLSQIEATLEAAHSIGVGIQGNILLGDPKETNETVKEAIEWRNKNVKYTLNCAQVTPYPGTELYRHCVEKKLIDPKSYIENHCPFVRMTEAELKFPVQMILGKALDIQRTGSDMYRGALYSLKAKCPHCGHISQYKDLYWGSSAICFSSFNSYRIGCRNCNQRYDILKEVFLSEKVPKMLSIEEKAMIKGKSTDDEFGPWHPDWDNPGRTSFKQKWLKANGGL